MFNYKISFQTILFGFLILNDSSFANPLQGKKRCSPPSFTLNTFEPTIIITIQANENDEILCRGSLIDVNWVLTTANCLKNIPLDDVRLMMGNEFVRKPKKTVERNGIALIEMDEPVAVAPIEFATKDHLENANNCVVSGFQRYVNDSVALVYWNMVNVSKRFNDIGELWHLDDAICLGRTSSAWNTIANGTPLICNSRLYGILLTDKPMVFGSISNYEKWIKRVIFNAATYDRAFVRENDFYFPDININTAIVAENTNIPVTEDYDTGTTATITEYTTEGTETEGTTSERTETEGTTSERTETEGTTSERTETDGPTSEGTKTDRPTSERTETEGTTSERTETDGPTSEGTETDGPTSEVTTQRLLPIFPFTIPITLLPPLRGLEGKMKSGKMPVVSSLSNKEPRDALVAEVTSSRKVKETTETTPVSVTALTAGTSGETFETEDGQFTASVTTVTAESSTENPSTTAGTTEEMTLETEDFIPGSNSTADENSLETEDASPIYVETPSTTTATNDISTSSGTAPAKSTTTTTTSTFTTTTTTTNIPNIDSTTPTTITNATTDEATTQPAHSTAAETSAAGGQTLQSDHTPETTTHVTESTESVVTESSYTSSSRIMLPDTLFITVLFFIACYINV